MLVGRRWPLIAIYCCQFSIPCRRIQLRAISSQVFYIDDCSHLRNRPAHIQHQNIETKRRQSLLRIALDNLAQDLLDLSEFLSQAHAERQQLLNIKTDKLQLFSRLKGDDSVSKAALVEQINTLKQSIQDLEKRIVKARQRKVPWSNFYI